jgi:hypothetical protein
LKEAFPNLIYRLATALKMQDRLIVNAGRERDYAAEALRSQRNPNLKDPKPLYRDNSRDLGEIREPWFYTNGPRLPIMNLRTTVEVLCGFASRAYESTSTFESSDYRQWFDDIDKAIEEILDIVNQVDRCRRIFDPLYLQSVCEWHNHQAGVGKNAFLKAYQDGQLGTDDVVAGPFNIPTRPPTNRLQNLREVLS